MKISFKFAWYDLWVGCYIDRWQKTAYLCLLPMLVIKFDCLSETEKQRRAASDASLLRSFATMHQAAGALGSTIEHCERQLKRQGGRQ